MKTKMTPIASWSIWAGGLSLVMGIITRKQLVAGFQSDETGMSYVIAALFFAGLAVSFLAALKLHKEWNVLKSISITNTIPHSNNSADLAAVFTKLQGFKDKDEVVDVHRSIDTYHTKHNSRVRSVSIMAALVISMGLLGTVVGLIMAISGLGGMVENIGLSRTTMMDALKTTVAGMGTAFYTTFFGSLGGLILRAVAVAQLNSLSELCSEASEYAANNLVVKLENKEEKEEKELDEHVNKIINSFEKMQIEIDTLTEHISTSFEGLNSSVNQATDSVSGSLADFKLAVDGTAIELNEAVGELHTSITEATGEMVTMAEAKFDTDAIEIAGHLSVAAESIQYFLKNKNGKNSSNKDPNQKVA